MGKQNQNGSETCTKILKKGELCPMHQWIEQISDFIYIHRFEAVLDPKLSPKQNPMCSPIGSSKYHIRQTNTIHQIKNFNPTTPILESNGHHQPKIP